MDTSSDNFVVTLAFLPFSNLQLVSNAQILPGDSCGLCPEHICRNTSPELLNVLPGFLLFRNQVKPAGFSFLRQARLHPNINND